MAEEEEEAAVGATCESFVLDLILTCNYPQVPEGLDAPRLGARRQRRSCRGPPTLKSMARHG